MPSKNGFGNTRKKSPAAMKYGAGKNPIMMNASPHKTKLGRYLMGRKKETGADGEEVIVSKKGEVVKTKSTDGTKTKYKKDNRPKVKNYETSDKSNRLTDKGRIVNY